MPKTVVTAIYLAISRVLSLSQSLSLPIVHITDYLAKLKPIDLALRATGTSAAREKRFWRTTI
jgi:hypothetical protein